MSKINVDTIQDSSGNQIKFPSSALSDGYLTVTASGVISSASIPQKTSGFTIYDASVDGGGGTTLNISKTLTADIKTKMLSGKQCTIIGTGVTATSQGIEFTDDTGNDAKWEHGGAMYKYKREHTHTSAYSYPVNKIPVLSTGLGTQSGVHSTNEHAGGFITNFRFVYNTSEESRPSLSYDVMGAISKGNSRVDENTSIETAEGRIGMQNTFTKLNIASCRVATNALIKLYIFED